MLPYVADFQLGIDMDKVDDKTGYGMGYLTARAGEASVRIPIVIQNFELNPMDVFIKDDEFHPLTEVRLREALFDPRMFSDQVPTDDNAGGYPGNYPPHSGKYVYASDTRSMLERIATTVSETDKKHFLGKLAGDSELLASYQSHGLTDVIRKVASMGRPKAESGTRLVHAALEPNVIMVEKIGYDQFKVSAVSDRLYSPIEKLMGGDELIAKFGSDIHTSVLENGEFSIVRGRRPAKPVILEGLTSDFKKLDEYGRCEVRTALNDRVLGWLFPKVVDLDGVALDGEKLFTDGESTWCLQPDIVGRQVLESNTLSEEPPSAELKPGVSGVFYYLDQSGRAFCTLPVTLSSAVIDAGDMMRMDVVTSLGECYTLEVSNGVESIMKSRRDKYTRYIPAKMRFCAVGRCQQLLNDPSTIAKFAEAKLAARSYVQVSTNENGDLYSFAGTDCDALSGGASNVPRSRAKFHLMSLGMADRDAVDVLDRASSNGRCTVSNMQPLLTEHEKSSEVRTEVIQPLLDALPRLKTDLIKEASFIPDAKTVDSVLSLNFINLENLNTFMESIPTLKQAGSKLAELLTASRIGLGVVQEEPTKKAMDNLERVVEDLESVRSSMRLQNRMG